MELREFFLSFFFLFSEKKKKKKIAELVFLFIQAPSDVAFEYVGPLRPVEIFSNFCACKFMSKRPHKRFVLQPVFCFLGNKLYFAP